ncbi:MAG: glycosyltransferase [Calothrix sp. MO_167.B12]|nr:glycosyltransferase [Calothrix sp. MO_167.B12]
MNKQPLVSCIIIFLNAGEKFFLEAIESIFAQTCNNWELLLVDDGSTDESTKIALHYAEKYAEKVRYLEHEGHQNCGMSAARNLGIRHAKGDYIAFLDADDVWLPNKLEEQIPILETHPEAAMLYGRTLFWYSWTGNPEDIERDCMTKTSVQFDTLIQPPTQLIPYLLDGGETYPCMCSVLIRSEVFRDIGAFEEEFRNANEDMVFHSKVFLNAQVFVSSKCWDWYRIHPNSYWQSAPTIIRQDNQKVERLKYLTWLEKYLSKQEIQNPAVYKALRKALFPYNHPQLYAFVQFFHNYVKKIKSLLKWIGKQLLPISVRRCLKAQYKLKNTSVFN